MLTAERKAANALRAANATESEPAVIAERLAASRKRLEEEQKAGIARLAASRAPSQAEQNTAAAAAKVLTAERKAANALRAANARRNALRNEKAAADMNAKIATGLNRLSAAAVPVKSNENHYRNIARSLTQKANKKRSALAVENMAIEVKPNAKRNADRLLAEGQARLPAPAKPSAVLGNEVVPGVFTNSVQPASQYHNRQSDGLNELS